MTDNFDVVVLGGGLAGLTVALQITHERPNTSILVLEKQKYPVAEAAHKVGESTVEIGAHYFNTVLGLAEHLKTAQLPKLGLRFFYPGKDNSDLGSRLELGGSDFYPTPSFQLDRGILENFLAEEIQRVGVAFLDETKVDGVRFGTGANSHAVSYRHDGEERIAQGRWVIDASGRGAILKQQLGLAVKNSHNVSAAWFRVKKEINIDDWVADPSWHKRTATRFPRRLSTNHLMGTGYWVWLIPLASGSTSVGIVADEEIHPLRSYNRIEKAMEWLRRYEPQCAEVLAGVLNEGEEMLQDFLALKHFSHGVTQVFSADRWCLTGESGAFLDPFYSPGSDFIAMSNTFVTELVIKELNGESISSIAPIYDKIYLTFFENTLSLYNQRYPLWGNQTVMSLKIIWDYAYYWGVLGQLFFNRKLCDMPTYVRAREAVDRIRALNLVVQDFFLAWNKAEGNMEQPGFLDMVKVPFLLELNRGLNDKLDSEQTAERIVQNIKFLETLAAELVSKGVSRNPLVAHPPLVGRTDTFEHCGYCFEALGIQ